MHKDATRQARTFNGCSRKKKERWVNVRCDDKFLCDRLEGDSWPGLRMVLLKNQGRG
jgi:hypothetical protein